MTATSIEWVRNAEGAAGHTINPLRARDRKDADSVGHFCEKISPGCANCYASRYQRRVHMFEFLPENRKKVKLFLDADKLRDVLARQAPTPWFWCDMTDMFGEWVTDEWVDAIHATIAASPRHTHMVLTKRAARMRDYYRELSRLSPKARGKRFVDALASLKDFDAINNLPKASSPLNYNALESWPIKRLRVGVSVENQTTADQRLPDLAMTPAWDRYISYEPALGAVTFKRAFCSCPDKPAANQKWREPEQHAGQCVLSKFPVSQLVTRIIVGGESGAGSRWNYIGWTKSAIRQGADLGVAIFNKQLGSAPTFTPIGTNDMTENPVKPIRIKLRAYKGNDPTEWPSTAPDGRGGVQPIDLKVQQWPD